MWVIHEKNLGRAISRIQQYGCRCEPAAALRRRRGRSTDSPVRCAHHDSFSAHVPAIVRASPQRWLAQRFSALRESNSPTVACRTRPLTLSTADAASHGRRAIESAWTWTYSRCMYISYRAHPSSGPVVQLIWPAQMCEPNKIQRGRGTARSRKRNIL